MMLMPLFSGRSHTRSCGQEIEIGLDQVPGLDDQVDEVGRTLDVFLGYATFRDQWAATRGADLFEGPPGTGKTVPRQGDGQAGRRAVPLHRRAGVPVDVVRHDELEGQSFFRRLRKLARKERARSGSSRRSTRSAANAAG